MTIKKEVLDLIEKLQQAKTGTPEWQEIIDILQRKYKMSSWAILGLYQSPPVVEFTMENMHLLLEQAEAN